MHSTFHTYSIQLLLALLLNIMARRLMLSRLNRLISLSSQFCIFVSLFMFPWVCGLKAFDRRARQLKTRAETPCDRSVWREPVPTTVFIGPPLSSSSSSPQPLAGSPSSWDSSRIMHPCLRLLGFACWLRVWSQARTLHWPYTEAINSLKWF